jgi:hypothetical protein
MTPAGNEKINQGARVAAATSEMSSGSRVRRDASHGKAKTEIPSPKFDTAAAEKNNR